MTRAERTIAAEPADSATSATLLREYLHEIVSRYHGREASEGEVDAEIAVQSDRDLSAPHGVFLVSWEANEPVGCLGLRQLDSTTAELTRMFVREAARGGGAGRQLLAAAEAAGRARGASRIRLDTRDDLVEARALYRACGYREIPAYNDAPYAQHWFEKCLNEEPGQAI